MRLVCPLPFPFPLLPPSPPLYCCEDLDLESCSVASKSAEAIELHAILNAFQHSPVYGTHVCEAFRDPQKYCMDDYWEDVQLEAFSVDELHRMVDECGPPATCARLHQFARVLERLSRRIDRVVSEYTRETVIM